MKAGSCFVGLCGRCPLSPCRRHDRGPLHLPEELLGCSNFCRGGRQWGECIEVTCALPQEPEGGFPLSGPDLPRPLPPVPRLQVKAKWGISQFACSKRSHTEGSWETLQDEAGWIAAPALRGWGQRECQGFAAWGRGAPDMCRGFAASARSGLQGPFPQTFHGSGS